MNYIIQIHREGIMKKILVVDDEKRIREIIVMYLIKEGYDVNDFDNADSAYDYFKLNGADLIVLDIMMRGTNGLDLCKKIRKESDVPIIFVSARNEELDRILGLELGADDYLAKPFSPRELVVRIKTILKRTTRPIEHIDDVLKSKDLEIYVNRRIVKCDGQDIAFTIKEYEVLELLMKNIDLPLSREQIIESIWGYDYDGYDRNVDDTIKRVRKKLITANSEIQIKTVWGYGYRIDNNE